VILYLSGLRGGLNGSMQHLFEARAHGFKKLRIVHER